MEPVAYGGWKKCVRLTNGRIEVIATADVGPRIIRFGYVGERNVFKEFEEHMGKKGGDEWRSYGGHRLWHAPENVPRTYAPDNESISAAWDGKRVRLRQPTEKSTGIEKEIEFSVSANTDEVRVLHRLRNHNPWDIETAVWALSVMAPGGIAVMPQEPFVSHEESLLPVRPLALWSYTNMADKRVIWGQKFVRLRQKEGAQPIKFGVLNSVGFAGYFLEGYLFVKTAELVEGATYPDYNVNFELFTDGNMLEVETLSPLTKLKADGGTIEHLETWRLYKEKLPKNEAECEALFKKLLG